MQLYFLRHASAEPVAAGGDAARALDAKGQKQAQRVAKFCRRHDLLPEIVLTSPLRRAVETAEIYCRVAGLPLTPVVEPWLALGRAGDEAMRELQAYSGHGAVMLVGHEPDFAMLVARLLGTAADRFDVTKASLIAIDVIAPVAGRGILKLFLPNRWMSE